MGGMRDKGREERDEGEEKELDNLRDSCRRGREKGKKEEDNGYIIVECR
jgi:hypothetical protein